MLLKKGDADFAGLPALESGAGTRRTPRRCARKSVGVFFHMLGRGGVRTSCMNSKDHVQAHTAERVNQRLQEEARHRVFEAAGQSEWALGERIRQLDRTWDIERWLEMNASALAFSGVLLGLFVNRKWFAIPCAVLPFLFLHAVQGWCPPIPVLRCLGVRTRGEIDEEKFALKALRGDFDPVDGHRTDRIERARDAWTGAME